MSDTDKPTRELYYMLVDCLNQSADSGPWDAISDKFARSIAGKNDDLLMEVLLPETDGALQRKIVEHLLAIVKKEDLERLADRIKVIREKDTALKKTGWFDYLLPQLNRTLSERVFHVEEKKKEIKEKVKEVQEFTKTREQLEKILQKASPTLKNLRFLESIPEFAEVMISDGNKSAAEGLISILFDGLKSENTEIRETVSSVAVKVGDKLLSERKYNLMARLSRKMLNWIKLENVITPDYQQITNQLKHLAAALIRRNKFRECEPILETYSQIHSGKTPKTELLRKLAGNMLSDIAEEGVFDSFLEEFKTNEKNQREHVTRGLIRLGVVSARPLLDLLESSGNRSERARIINILTQIGRPIIPILTEELKLVKAWFFIRNLILILGRIGEHEHVQILIPFLYYRDIRVQREALNSIYSIGGNLSEDVILATLETADDRFKVDIVEIIGLLKSRKAVPKLIEILEREDVIASRRGIELAEKVILALHRIGSVEAVPILRSVLKGKGVFGRAKQTEAIESAAADALAAISGEKGLNEDTVTIRMKRADLISNTSFSSRNVSGRNIGGVIDKAYMETWSGLFNNLTEEERDAFYFALKEGTCLPNRLLFKQGGYNSRLFFIDDGELVLAYDQGDLIKPFGKRDIEGWDDTEVWIKSLTKGDIAGHESFFDNFSCTVSLRTINTVHLHYLERSQYQKLIKDYPGLEDKIRIYCDSFESIPEMLQKFGMERRREERVGMGGDIHIRLLDGSSRQIGKLLTGELSDISTGGLSFEIAMPGDTARKLPGRNLNIRFFLMLGSTGLEVNRNGSVVGVLRRKDPNSYLVRVKFEVIFEKLKNVLPLPKDARAMIDSGDDEGSEHNSDFLSTRIPP